MSKRKIILLSTLSIIGLLVIWTIVSLVWTGGGDGTRNDPYRRWRGLRLEVANVTPEGLELSMVNRFVLRFNHGTAWSVEQYIDGVWVEPPVIQTIRWTLPILHVRPLQRTQEEVPFVWWHGELPTGQYRILRSFSSGIYLYAPFMID